MFFFVLTGSLVIAGLVVGLTPFLFVKLNAIEPIANFSELLAVDADRAIDPVPLLENIPYQNKRIVDVLPKRRYRKTIHGGLGDCANFSYGFAFHLNNISVDYSIVHLLRSPGFEVGTGHVALETALEFGGLKQSAILDLFEGGILHDEDKLISVKDIVQGTYNDIRIIPLNKLRDDHANYYATEILANTVIGITPKNDMVRYFKFINRVYFDLDARNAEKYIYQGLALLSGYYPRILIDVQDAGRLFGEHQWQRRMANAILWSTRALVLVMICFGFSLISRRIRG